MESGACCRAARCVSREANSTATPYFTLREELDPQLEDQRTAVRLIRSSCREAVARRLNGERQTAVFLSGGIDSSGVALWLNQAGVQVRAVQPGFRHGRASRNPRPQPSPSGWASRWSSCRRAARTSRAILPDLIWKLDLPFGDPVTGPQYLLARAARRRRLHSVFNGEGGDQLFGGWTSKPMISAELYAGLYEQDSREELYLRSYHRFYGLEEQLYTPQFRAQVGGPGQRRAHLAPYLAGDAGHCVSQSRAAGGHFPQRLAEHPAEGRADRQRARARPARAAVRSRSWPKRRSACRRS